MPPDRSQFLARLASLTQVIFAVLLGGVAAFASDPGFAPRSVVLVVLFSLPGVVGLIGTAARRPALLLAAGLTSFVGAFIAFSGVTLIFLVPAFLFLAGAVRLARSNGPSNATGLVGSLAQMAIAAAITVLLVGAGLSSLLATDSGCWTEIRTPTGIRVEPGPYSAGGIEVPAGATSVSCSTGLISARGVGLGALLGVAAVGLAVLAARRGEQMPDRAAERHATA